MALVTAGRANFITAAVFIFPTLIADVLPLLAPLRRLRQIGLDGVAITESRQRMWLLSLLWAGKGKGRRHLGVTWNRGQLMIQFREAFFPYRFAWASCCSVSGRFQQTPLTSRPLPSAPCPDCRLEAGLARPLHTCRALHVYVHTPLCHLFYAYAA